MNASDQKKVLDAGFIILRAELSNMNNRLRIKAKTNTRREWHTFMDHFENKTQMLKRMKALLKNNRTIED